MINCTGLKSAAQAGAYYDADDYYAESGQAPSRWFGAAADALGLRGSVDREQFQQALSGQLPNGQELGRMQDGERKHAPGWDLTFSASKSVSVAAFVGGDMRLQDAHREAVGDALAYVQEHAVTRVRQPGGQIDRQETGSLAVAVFDHATSRNLDPQMHSHAIVLNATQDRNGQFRSLEGREFYRIQTSANEVYQQALAAKVRELGYDIEQTKDGWELSSVSAEVRGIYSERTEAINAWLEAHGYDRATAPADVRERASLATRPPKEKNVDHAKLADRWRERARAAGVSIEATTRTGAAADPADAKTAAAEAVERAASHLSERSSRFTQRELEARAIREARASSADLAAVRVAINQAGVRGDLVPRMVNTADGERAGWTTDQAIRTERAFLAVERASRESAEPLLDLEAADAAVKAAEASSEHPWTKGQREAATGILASSNRIQAVQGYAGTAKTTTVLRAVAAQAEAQGLTVRGMAPTRSAAEQLAEGAGLTNSTTVKSALLEEQRRQAKNGEGKELWLVDESSLMSAKDTADLLRASERAGARVVLVGDVAQLASVEAGESFRQLQANGMQTHVLDDIVRQCNQDARTAVYQSIDGDARQAMQSIERSGRIIEHEGAAERRAQMAKDYLALSADDRKDTLVIDPTRSGRADLNQKIREGLRAEGALSGPEIEARTLEKKDLTREESKDASRYEPGDLVRFGKDLKGPGIEAGQYYRVGQIDYAKGTVTLTPETGGKAVKWQPARAGAKTVEAFQEGQAKVASGERLQWTQNDHARGLVNGQQLTVQKVDGSTITARDQAGKTHQIDTSKSEGQHFRHAYATTVHAAQGRTSGRVMANLSTEHRELLSQRSYYTAISRAKEDIRLYTNDRAGVARQIERNAGVRQTALEGIKSRAAERPARAPKAQKTAVKAQKSQSRERSRGRG